MTAARPTPDSQVLRAFSSCLLALGDVTHGASVERIIEEAMRTLQPLVRFERAWWGQVAAGRAEARNWLQGHIGLSASFGEEWNQLASQDDFGQQSMQQLGQVVRSSEEDPPGDVQRFSDRYGLRHAMAITVELPGSGLLFFVSLYRADPDTPFTDADEALFAEFMAHLLQGWRRRLSAIHARLALPSWEDFAVADPQGRLLYLGRRATAELKRAFAHWNGWVLPQELTAVLTDPSGPARVPPSLTVQRVGTLLAVACTRTATRRLGLTPSQWNVAMLYAQGQSYTEIAHRLGRSPATVRTYLRDAYAQLGVSNKIELLAALHDADR